MLRSVWLCVLGAELLTGGLARAEDGTYLEQEVITEAAAGRPQVKGIQRIWLTPRHIRNEIALEDSVSVALFDLEKDRMILLPSEEKQYIEMSLEGYQRIVAMRLGGAGLADAEAQPRLTAAAEQKKVGDWQCSKYVFEQGGKTPIRSELWVSRDTGLQFRSYLDLMKKLGMEKTLGKMVELAASIDGYPVEVRNELTQQGQKVVSSHRVLKIVNGPVDPALFRVPEGYQRVDEGLPAQKEEKRGGP